MKLRVLVNLTTIFAAALISYSTATAQVIEKVKDTKVKTTEVTIDTTKKTVEMTKDAADKTKTASVNAAKTNNPGAKRFGGYKVELVDNVKGQTSEAGRWLTVTTWDGTKWVSKRTWTVIKKAAEKTKSAVTGDKNKKQ